MTKALAASPVTNPKPPSARIRHAAGILIAAMIALVIVSGLWPGFPRWPAGLAAWLAGALLVAHVPFGQKVQVAALIGVGAAALGWALSIGAQPPWSRLLDTNAGLLAMIASVGFLRLVALTDGGAVAQLPVGASAYRRTLLGVAVFGSFINVSAPILVADRLARQGRVDRLTSQSITRVFSGCSSWSPFFGGMAVVLTYVPDTRLAFVMLAGLPFALIGLLVVTGEAQWRHREALADFRGYPLSPDGLWIPLILAIAVSVGFALFPRASVLLIISISALTVSGVVLVARLGARRAAQRLKTHITDGLPGMIGELLLFVAAGVLAVGLGALVDAGHVTLPLDHFDAGTASQLLGAILLGSAVGLHPVISIAALTPVLAPIAPEPQLLAITYLLGWSLGTCASPLSGTHLIFQGRYGVPSFSAAVWNWPYAIAMYGVAVLLLHVVAQVRGVS